MELVKEQAMNVNIELLGSVGFSISFSNGSIPTDQYRATRIDGFQLQATPIENLRINLLTLRVVHRTVLSGDLHSSSLLPLDMTC